MKILALSGKMHSGKSYVSEHLVKEFGFTRYSFAKALKDDIQRMGFSTAQVYDKPDWMRQLMQVYGQAKRAVDPDYWARQLTQELEFVENEVQLNIFAMKFDEPKIVIDDMRFPNEAEALRKFGYCHDVTVVLMRLEREGYDRTNIAHSNDVSETALDGYAFDWTKKIKSGDLPGLRALAENLGVTFHGRTAGAGTEGSTDNPGLE